MKISLTPSLADYVKAKVDSGEYASVDEVVQAGLCVLLTRDVEAGIERGLADSAAGRTMSSDECFSGVKSTLK